MTDFKKTLFDPSALYAEPQDVLVDGTLSQQQQLRILKQWEYDARRLIAADEENMLGDGSSMLQRVLTAIRSIEPDYDSTRAE